MRRRWLLAGVLLGVVHSAGAWSTLNDWATVIATQVKDRQPLPVLSAYGAGLTLDEAYAVQKLVVESLTPRAKVAGYRAGLTRPLGQVRFDVQEPVTGVVFRDQILRGSSVLLRREYRNLTIAPGLGYVLRAAVSAPLSDPVQLESLIGAVLPVVDFANLDFEPPHQPTASDLVAGNVAVARVLVGKPLHDPRLEQLDSVLVELSRAGAVVDRGRGTNVLGGQRMALYWLINRLLTQGWDLPAGALLLTGGLSDPVPAQPGEYVVKYWDLGNLEFRVRP